MIKASVELTSPSAFASRNSWTKLRCIQPRIGGEDNQSIGGVCCAITIDITQIH